MPSKLRLKSLASTIGHLFPTAVLVLTFQRCCNGQTVAAQDVTSVAASPNDAQDHYYLLLQLGGEDAFATPSFLTAAENALYGELNNTWANCNVLNAWNLSTCMDGVPVMAPFNTLGSEGLLSEIVGVGSPGPGPAGNTWTGRHLLQETSLAPTEQDGPELEGSAPSPSMSCLPQMEAIFQLMPGSSSIGNQLNQTYLLINNGGFLARMQASNVKLEEALILDLTNDTAVAQVGAPGPTTITTGLFTVAPNSSANASDVTVVIFSLSLIGPDAEVTNDAMLSALYEMLTDPTFNGGSPWLTTANTAIVDVRQGTAGDQSPSSGRRRLFSQTNSPVLTSWGRRLSQDDAAAPVASGIPTVANNPCIYVSIKVQNLPTTEVLAVKSTANLIVNGNTLVNGFQERGIDIVAAQLTNFDFQATNQPPAQAAAAPALAIAPRSSRHTILVLVSTIAIPVCVFGAIFAGCAFVWWGRYSRRRLGAYQSATSLSVMSKGVRHDSEASLESLAMLTLRPDGSKYTGDSNSSLKQNQLLDMPWNDWKIEPSELTILSKPDGNKWLLGTGASGTVYKALRSGVQIVAVKFFRDEVTRGAITSFNSWSQAAQFRREISILKSCHDRNIVQFVGACLAEGQTCLVTEFLENGDLYRAINSPQGSRYHWYRLQSADGKVLPNSGMAKRVALDVARGLHFLHTRKIVHFDLKSANILLARDFTAKIADVGLAKVLHDDVLSARREVGTFAWAAPEVLLGQRTTEAADIYSFGVLLHELSAQESPRDRQLRRLGVPEEVPSEVNDLIMRCLNIKAEERPTARDLVASLSCINISATTAPLSSQQPQLGPRRPTQAIHSFSIDGGAL